jgi:hypothetical protein
MSVARCDDYQVDRDADLLILGVRSQDSAYSSSSKFALGYGQHYRDDRCHNHQEIHTKREERRLAKGKVVLPPDISDDAFRSSLPVRHRRLGP